MPIKLLHSRKTSAYMLSISTRSLDWLIKHKRIATQKLGSKVMITHTELVRFAKGDHTHLTAQDGAAA